MKFLIFLIALCQPILAKERSIAVLVKPDYRGELSFAYRIKAAAENLHWSVDVLNLNALETLKKSRYDFAIRLVPGAYKRLDCKSYLAIFHPGYHYFHLNGDFKKKYHCYDGFLLTYRPNVQFTGHNLPYIAWYPTTQKIEYTRVDPTQLFHICCPWGNRFEDRKFKRFLTLLDREPYTRFYGSPSLKKAFPHSYQSTIPFEGDDLFKIASEAGVSLILHSDRHNACGVPSGKIFEAAAASTVIISDENAFIKEHFGDSVLYINTKESAESILHQVQRHMHWIQTHREAALEKAKIAHEIYEQHFLLEEQLLRLSEFHDRLSQKTPWIQKICSLLSSWAKKIFCLGWSASLIHPIPLTVLPNIDHQYSLINSIDFHPRENLFCATYTHNNKLSLYEIDEKCELRFLQNLCNPLAKLSEPQHAAFSPDGNKIIVANWTNQTFNLYLRQETGLFSEKPAAIIQAPKALRRCKPHGIAFSPCGNYLAVAYGAARYFERGIALFQNHGNRLECLHLLKNKALSGTPKGIAFSPDGTSLLVTFCEPDSLGVFKIENQTLIPQQTIQGMESGLSRPEDIKISPDGSYCAVSNSDRDTVTFYPFDRTSNSISQNTPSHTLQNPEAQLSFPHGIAFSPDGTYLAITQFGPVQSDEQGDIFWTPQMKSSEASINFYLVKPY